MSKFYAVKVGKVPGIYTEWERCREQVIGFKGAIYKSFAKRGEAEEFLSRTNRQEDIDGLVAYVDGSFMGGTSFGCGCVLLFKNEIIAKISKKYDDNELVVMNNVAGEIKASELAMKYAIENDYESISIYHDYQGISSWCLGEWKANKSGTKAYKNFYDSIKRKLKVNFIKVKGHSGDKYNDMADELAKKALL